MSETRYEVMKILGDALYDHQDVRMASANRVRGLLKTKLIEANLASEDSDWTDEMLMEKLAEATAKNVLNPADIEFINSAVELVNRENRIELEYEKLLAPQIKTEPIVVGWLNHVKGISTRNASRLLHHFGYCERFETVGKLWAYSGLAVQDGHSIKRVKGEKLPYNLKIKTSCVGVIGDSLIRASGGYKQLYDQYKARIMRRGCCENPYKGSDKAKKGHMCKEYPGHAHRMAIRYMVKMFLAHYWLTCRQIKGLAVREPYAMEKLGHTTVIDPIVDC